MPTPDLTSTLLPPAGDAQPFAQTPLQARTRTDAQPATQHLEYLLSQRCSLSAIAVAGELSMSALRRLRTAPEHVQHGVLVKVCALTPAIVHAISGLVPAQPYVARAFALTALGWPIKWQERQIGTYWVSDRNRHQLLQGKTAAAADQLFARIGFRPPDPERSGLRREAITRARRFAAARGHRPPHPDSRYRWAALHAVVLGSRSQEAVADQFRLPDAKNVERWCHGVGLRVEWKNQEFGTISRRLHWESEQVAAYVTEALQAMDVDRAALMRGTWSVLGISAAFDASAAWAQVRAQADQHRAAGQREQTA